MRVRVVGVLFVGWLVASVSAEQARPIFTGMWTFVGEKSTPGNRSALGDEIRITQEANALVLEGPTTQFVRQPGGTTKCFVGGLGPAMVYKMDGEEHTPTRDPVRSSQVGFTFYYLSDGPYRVLWDGNALVIAGSDEFLYTSKGTMVWVRRRLSTRLSMNADGTLAIERTIERDPADKGKIDVKQGAYRSIYRKVS
jgi:hypothetical protein